MRLRDKSENSTGTGSCLPALSSRRFLDKGRETGQNASIDQAHIRGEPYDLTADMRDEDLNRKLESGSTAATESIHLALF